MQITKQIQGRETWRRLGFRQVLIAVDPETNQLLRYKELMGSTRYALPL